MMKHVVMVDVRPAEGDAGVEVAVRDGRLVLSLRGESYRLHALWLRERASGPADIEPTNRQRLVEPTDLPPHLAVSAAILSGDGVTVTFTDGETRGFSLAQLATAVGATPELDAVPEPQPWACGLDRVPTIGWTAVLERDLDALLDAVGGFHRFGCLLITGSPTRPGSLLTIAGSFGRVSATNFGELFDVRSVPDPVDLAYTPVGLTAHTDQPYRRPAPGVQFLHALTNDAHGGESSVVDGLAAVEALRRAEPRGFEVLSTLAVEFRYDVGCDVVVGRAPMIELDVGGRLRHFRFSPRLDFAPAVDPDLLDEYYAARRWLAAWLNDPRRQSRFKLAAGDVLVVDNHRVLHGREPFDPTTGRRHLQGCYIDHDGLETTWRLLVRERVGRR